MAQQGSLFRLFINALNYRSVLTTRTTTSYQQCAGIKQRAIMDKIEDLNIPERPKKPLPPYFRYATDQKPHILKKFPDIKFAEISKKLAEDWAAADPGLKEEYSNNYSSDLESYKKVLDEYNMKLTPVQKEALELLYEAKKSNKKRRLIRKLRKVEAKPKRPIGAYMLYLLATSKQEGLKVSEALSTMKGKWAMLSDLEKDRYKQIYEEDKQRYEAEMKVWEAKMIQEGKLELVRQNTLNEIKPSRLGESDVVNKSIPREAKLRQKQPKKNQATNVPIA